MSAPLPFLPAQTHPDVLAAQRDQEIALAGLLPLQLVRTLNVARPGADLVSGFLALPDLTSLVADILDTLEVDTSVASGRLRPLRAGQRTVGPAITVRHSRVRSPSRVVPPRLGGLDQIALTRRGDVLVIDAGGEQDASSFGGLMATAALQQGLSGIVIDGALRDGATMVRDGLAAWSASATPRTGKHRLELVEVNGAVDIAGVQVWPGDLVLADDDGIVFVPAALASQVLQRAIQASGQEAQVLQAMRDGAGAAESLAILPPEKW